MAVKKRRIDEIGDESRRRILDAAEELFGEQGFERTTFVDIAERSGISRGSIPWHFRNKDGLLIAVYERAVQRFLDQHDRDQGNGHTIREEMERTEEWLQRPAAAMVYNTITAALTAGDPVHNHFVKFHRGGRRHLAAVISASTPDETVPAGVDPDQLAGVINGAFIGLHLQRHLDPTFDMSGAMQTLIAMVELALGVPDRRTVDGVERGLP